MKDFEHLNQRFLMIWGECWNLRHYFEHVSDVLCLLERAFILLKLGTLHEFPNDGRLCQLGAWIWTALFECQAMILDGNVRKSTLQKVTDFKQFSPISKYFRAGKTIWRRRAFILINEV